jgi:hemerythrin-like domain-containing protein
VNRTRRELLTGISVVGAGALLAGCKRRTAGNATGAPTEQAKADESSGDESGGDVSAVEDLMREHGLLRRALLVYQESVVKLRENATSVPLPALEKNAQLFRAFGEDYHEKKLEEVYIIPSLKKVQGPATVYTDVLLAQHARGREITDYILAVTKADKLPAAAAGPFVEALEAFVRMYEHHAAIEDTIIFPAWKENLSDEELDSLGGTFEEIETAQFGEDGFEAALKRMAEIEESLGLANLGMFTAPAPPAPPPLPSPSPSA